MRDDLHRTVAVSARWLRVLRCAPRKSDRETRLVDAHREAIRLTLTDGLRESWLAKLRGAMSTGNHDFFAQDSAAMAIRRCEALAASPLERELAERIRTQLQMSGATGTIAEAMRDVATRIDERSREHVLAKVRQKHPGSCTELRVVLQRSSALADSRSLIDDNGDIVAKDKRSPVEMLSEVVE